MPLRSKWQFLPTEAINPSTLAIDKLSPADIVEQMMNEDRKMLTAVHREKERIAVGILPDQQLVPGLVIGIDNKIPVGIEIGQDGETVHFRAAEQLRRTVDRAVFIHIPRQQRVIRIHPGGLLGKAISVDIEKRRGCGGIKFRQLNRIIGIQIDYQWTA